MLQLLNPIGLLAASAVLIPILVHLWRERKGKTLRIGSIALLGNSNRTRSNSLRIHNWPLFLLRCLLLLLLAFLLAKPVWQQSPIARGVKGWILVPKAEQHIAYRQYKSLIDSLLAAQWELHDLGEGFETFATGEQEGAMAEASLPNQAGRPRRYLEIAESPAILPWELLRGLESTLPAGYPLQVFTSNRLAQYEGGRPATSFNIGWHSYQPVQSTTNTPVASWITPQNTVRSLDLVSAPEGNRYTSISPATLPDNTDTSVLRIALYPGSNQADAQYIKAALQAIGEVNERRIQLTTVTDGQPLSVPQQLIFQLDALPTLPLSTLGEGGRLLRYDTGATVSFASWQQDALQVSGNSLHNRVYRYAAGTAVGQPVWTLANGQTLLSVQDTAGKQIYHFKGRFNPASTDMVWEDGFVQQVLPLVLPSPAPSLATDVRRIDDRQVVPARSTTPRPANIVGKDKPAPDNSQSTGLAYLTGLLIILVFAAERLLTYRQQKPTRDA